MASKHHDMTKRFYRSFGLDIEKWIKLGNIEPCVTQTQCLCRPRSAKVPECRLGGKITWYRPNRWTAEPKHRRDRGIVKKENQVAKSKPDDTESIVRKFQKIHGGTFDYSKVDYFNHTTKVIIICRRHGPFEQQPRLHLRGSTGCRKCIAERGK